jgi:hypothetical protein
VVSNWWLVWTKAAMATRKETVPTNQRCPILLMSNRAGARRPATRALLLTDPNANPVSDKAPQPRPPLSVPVICDREPWAPRDCTNTLTVQCRFVNRF